MAKDIALPESEQGSSPRVGSGRDLFRVAQTRRTMKAYGITDSELGHISHLNTLASVFFSLASVLVVLAIGFWTDWLIEGKPENTGEVLADVVAPLCAFLALVFFIIAVAAIIMRRSTVNCIKNESEVISE